MVCRFGHEPSFRTFRTRRLSIFPLKLRRKYQTAKRRRNKTNEVVGHTFYCASIRNIIRLKQWRKWRMSRQSKVKAEPVYPHDSVGGTSEMVLYCKKRSLSWKVLSIGRCQTLLSRGMRSLLSLGRLSKRYERKCFKFAEGDRGIRRSNLHVDLKRSFVVRKAEEAAAHLKNWLFSGSLQEVLSTTEAGNPLTRNCLRCLLPGYWLNDEVINHFFSCLQKQSHGRIWCPNSFFWPKLNSEGPQSVRRWAPRAQVDIAALNAVLVPIHLAERQHWALAAVEVQEGKVHYCDSLGLKPPGKLESRFREYLRSATGSWGASRSWSLVEQTTPLLMQGNCSDCGVFACMYAERLASGKSAGCGSRQGSAISIGLWYRWVILMTILGIVG
eukprot:gnl/MRDRNA2_/MRDRNA2_17810_c0_seq1.p1 gnl/MRDRNA2_/MRDRNA2_17810_c0~~gnl/MRDRNA2_/MRDRNA2_17810_c0_seq1.p1  ORF type:complete len:385 (-),score=39.68 gnl/MRDRNA2_/MRDRNA2_17810_c0_seq1:65-1219(-)